MTLSDDSKAINNNSENMTPGVETFINYYRFSLSQNCFKLMLKSLRVVLNEEFKAYLFDLSLNFKSFFFNKQASFTLECNMAPRGIADKICLTFKTHLFT